MMQIQYNSSTLSLEKVVDRILFCGKLTPRDRYLLESAIMSQKIWSRTQQGYIARVYDGLNQGSISVID